MAKIFTEQHRRQLVSEGVVRIENVVPRDVVEHVLSALLDEYGLDIDNPKTWYRLPPENYNIAPLHHSQAQWDVRQYPRVLQMFSELWRTEHLWINPDRIAFQPPEKSSHPIVPIHWDLDPRIEADLVQAFVYVVDVPEEGGAFRAVSEAYRNLDPWIAKIDAHVTDLEGIDFTGVATVPVPGKAGDFVIWESATTARCRPQRFPTAQGDAASQLLSRPGGWPQTRWRYRCQ